MLTGEDKSTWFWLLKNGYEMAYLPDVRSWSMETQSSFDVPGMLVNVASRWCITPTEESSTPVASIATFWLETVSRQA